MKARGWILGALLGAAALGAGWWFGSPWWTLYQMKTAAERHDLNALAGHVDYPALREDLGRQIRERLKARGDFALRPAETLLAGALATGAAGVAASPEVLESVFGGTALDRTRNMLAVKARDMEMRRDGLDQFRMVDRSGSGTELVFRRDGLDWKLAGIRLPRHMPLLGLER